MNKLILVTAATLGIAALFTLRSHEGRATAAVSDSAPQTVSSSHEQRRPSAELGSITLSTPAVEPAAGDLFVVALRVEPREACAEGLLTITTGPSMELVAGNAKEAVALAPGQPIVRELQFRKTADVDTSVIVTVHGKSARRGGAWSYSDHHNFRLPESKRQAPHTFVGANGVVLVGDR